MKCVYNKMCYCTFKHYVLVSNYFAFMKYLSKEVRNKIQKNEIGIHSFHISATFFLKDKLCCFKLRPFDEILKL